jgi:hypothetical protein
MKSSQLFILFFAWLSSVPLYGQDNTTREVLDMGLRFQKSVGLYYENGITAQYTGEKLARQRLYFGLSYITSRLGTALSTNALRQDNILTSATFLFWPKSLIRPLVRGNLGYFTAYLGDSMFDDLPNKSLLASGEGGLCLCPDFPLKLYTSIGYNLITGNGIKGPGTLYPVFIQTSITWNILKNSK